MLISSDWIKDFVDLPELDSSELLSRVTLATAEVEGLIESGAFLEDISVVEIQSLRKHPDADKLNLVTFKLNDSGETKEVVCGAPNVREGLRVPYAKIGVTLPNGLTLEPKKIRGFLSEGMLCSATELGLGEDASGLLELPNEAPLGQDMLNYLEKKKDIIVDIDNKSLTHRPDLWGHYGFAREFAAIWDQELKVPYNDSWAKNLETKFTSDPSPISPKIMDDCAALSYWGLSVDGVTVGESPAWMQERLINCGLRPINSIVDISNYVMLELGMPNHIFDRESISNNTIEISTIGSETKFTTLDEIERNLVSSDTVIKDSEKPLVIAGIMGGANSGVSSSTTKVFIEVANWKAALVRKTSSRLGLRTDSSQRYEKSLDSKLTYRTLLRILDLILELNPGATVIGKAEYDGISLNDIPELTLKTTAESINTQLGTDVSEERMIKIFESLGFDISANNSELLVKIPSYRSTKDIDCEADLVEEIGRIIGYDNITPSSPLSDIKTTKLDSTKKLHRSIQDFLVYRVGALEVMSYPLVGTSLLKKASWPIKNEKLTLVNALSVDHNIMRPSLIPGLLQSVANNQKNFSNFTLFELGRSYLVDDKEFSSERRQLVIAYYNKKSSEFGKAIDDIESLMLSNNIPGILGNKNSKFRNPLVDSEWMGVHPFEYQDIKIMGKNAGVVFSCHPILLRKFKIKGNLTFAMIDLTDFERRELKDKIKYQTLPKYPHSTFDCTVVADKKKPVGDVLKAFKGVKGKELKSYKVVDVFHHNETEKSVTLRATLFDPNKTMDGETLKAYENKIIESLGKAGFELKQG